ncbi:MAG: VWA domain-containing protein [Planctomycetaceae bacterium]
MFDLLNPAMLFGLAGLALPVLAHLLSKRKFDIVEWGAMRFLEIGQRTKRKIKLEELLLLLLRMGLIAAAVFAMTRPWVRSSLFAGLGGGPRRDVVYVVDGSYSMGWEGRAVTPHAAATQWVHDAIEQLGPGDNVGLLDARDQVRPVVSPLTSDFDLLRSRLDELPQPSGTSRLLTAAQQAVQMLGAGTNLRRDVVILTDGQALAWSPEDQASRMRLAALVNEAAVKPDIWLVDIGSKGEVERINYSVGALRLSRELTVPDFTVRVQTVVRQSGGTHTRRNVYLEVNGQRLDDKTLNINLPPDGEAFVQFDHRFAESGSYVISVVLEPDHLPGDNRAEAAVVIEDGLPVLLVDGDPQADPVQSETFFARSALTPQGVSSPWVRAKVITTSELSAAELEGRAAVFLCNVPQLTADQTAALEAFVASGGGLVIAPGDRTDAQAWNQLAATADGLLPGQFVQQKLEADAEERPVLVKNDSLQMPWITMFRSEEGDGGFDFTRVRYSTWWQLAPTDQVVDAAESVDSELADDAAAATDGPSLAATGVQVAARLSTGDPAILRKTFGRGSVVLLAIPVDDAWSTLPGSRALAPLLHEIVFLAAGHQRGRNVDAGTPLLAAMQSGTTVEDYRFVTPTGAEVIPSAAGDEFRPEVRLNDTSIAGTYKLTKPAQPDWPAQFFVVNFDRNESDLTSLTEPEVNALTQDGLIRAVDSLEELVALQADDAPKKEVWAMLLFVVLGLLSFEVFMTRRLVQRGHGLVDSGDAD